MTLFRRYKRLARLVFGALAALTGADGAPVLGETITPGERSVAAFYSGRRMIMISGHTPEGGDRQQERVFAGMTITSSLEARGDDDLHGRLLARHMGRHVPGRPQFVVQTMPGAGGRRAANYLFQDAPKDGTVIGNLERGLAVEPLLIPDPTRGGVNHSRFDPARFNWLGSLVEDIGFVVAWGTAGNLTANDLLGRAMLVGGTAPLDDTVLLARGLNVLLGTRFKLISGYSGSVELQIAMERGEIDGFLSGSSDIKSRLIPWMANGQARALLQLGLRRDPAFPDVPLALEFARSEDDRQALEFVFARQSFGSPYVAPPGVPDERIAALRRAFDATMSDSEFLAEAARLDAPVRPLSGLVLTEMVARLLATPAAVRTRAAAAVSRPTADERSRVR